MLAILLAMISLPDLDPEPVKTPAATIGQRLSGGDSGAAVQGLLDSPPAIGELQFTPICGSGVMPLVQNELGDMSALSHSLASPACLPAQGRFGSWLASPSGYVPFGEFTPVALPIFAVRPPSGPTLHMGPPSTGAFPFVTAPAASSATARRGLEMGESGSWHRGLESPTVAAPATHLLQRPAPARASR